ncbi:hypothetical protein O6H91_13G030800 [Diphasiastrum complanatum]|nr:hypothetical protein O6H91_13G030800 [Diphasiastrum complanatum]
MIRMMKALKMREYSRGRRAVVCAIGGREVYQPFRPPAQKQSSGALSVQEQLNILKDREGLWHEYAAHIPSLTRSGFAPSSIEEATGLSGVEQNQIVVASQVRSSLAASGLDKAALDFFDVGGVGILYELRILSAHQRKSAAEVAVQRNMDAKDARDLARAVKDYSRRKNEEGWGAFSSSPGDCLAFACYRASNEHSKDEPERESILRRGLSFVESIAGRVKLLKALGVEVEEEVEEEKKDKLAEGKTENKTQVDIAELSLGETAGLVMLAVAEPNPTSIEAAPHRGALGDGPFRIYRSETPWKTWVPLPAWEPVVAAAAPIALFFSNSKILFSQNSISSEKSRIQEPILVVVDKGRLELEENTFYLVAEEMGDNVLSIQSGSSIIQNNRKPLARFLIALKPPFEVPDLEEDAWD